MAGQLPALTGRQLIRLLEKDGFAKIRQSRHGQAMTKTLSDGRILVTTIPNKRGDLTTGTLHAILGPKQTQIGIERLKELIKKYGK